MARRRPDQREIVGSAVIAGAGLVTHAPARGKRRADPLRAHLVAAQPVEQLRALLHRERLPERQRLQAARHRGGRRRIARIAGNRIVQRSFHPVQPEHRIARQPSIRGDGLRSTEQFDQQIGGRVIAVLNGCHA